ncbi:MAG: hypothetical protein J7M14_03850, partial [Planctomycetes bacterium]|nr:hypothetical protein [Planctomycetota bacterium]
MAFATVAAMALVLTAGGCGSGIRVPKVDRGLALAEAHDVLHRCAGDSDCFVRSAAIEAMADVMGVEQGEVYLKALDDKEANVRFAAALAVGDTRYAPAKARLLQMAKQQTPGAERDQRVFCGVIYALQRLGCNDYVGELGKLLFHKENEVRANAAMVIGKIGWPSGIEPLKALLGEETREQVTLRLQLLESLSMLGDERSTLMLESYARKPFLVEKLVALRA